MTSLLKPETQSLNRNMVFTLAVACALTVANLYYNQPLLADIGRSFHVSAQQAGIIPTLTQLGYALGLVLLVPLGDRMQPRKLIVALLVFVSVALVFAALSPNFASLAIASLVIGFATVVPQVIVPFAALLSAPQERGKTIGIVMGGLLIGILLARTISGFVGGRFGWQVMYWTAAGLMLMLAVGMARLLPRTQPTAQLSYSQLLQSLGHLVRQQPILREASLVGALWFAAFSAFWATLTFFLETPPYHYGSEVAGLFGLVGAVGALAASLTGRLVDRRSPRSVISVALAIVLAAFVIFFVAGTHLAALILGVILLDLGTQSAMISNQTRVYSLLPDAQSRLTTVYITTYFLGGAIGSLLGTYAWEQGHWQGVSALGIGFVALAIAVHLFKRNKSTG